MRSSFHVINIPIEYPSTRTFVFDSMIAMERNRWNIEMVAFGGYGPVLLMLKLSKYIVLSLEC